MKIIIKKIFIFIILLNVCFTLISCHEDSNPFKREFSGGISIIVEGTDIYIAANYNEPYDYEDGSGYTVRREANYWKNGSWTNLHPKDAKGANSTSSANTIMLLGGSVVFIVGSYSHSNNKVSAFYWVNGIRTDLKTPQNYNATATDITIAAGGDIYISGRYYNNDDTSKACYWKNGVMIEIDSSDSNESFTRSIIAKGNDIYIVGEKDRKACYWKNDELIYLNTMWSSRANDIAILGEDIYIVGLDTREACYWKNGELIYLTSSYNMAEAYAIAILGEDIYIVGKDGRSNACYWKNGELIILQSDGYYANASSIAIYGDDIYIAGYYAFPIRYNEHYGWYDSRELKVCYWKNGIRIDLK